MTEDEPTQVQLVESWNFVCTLRAGAKAIDAKEAVLLVLCDATGRLGIVRVMRAKDIPDLSPDEHCDDERGSKLDEAKIDPQAFQPVQHKLDFAPSYIR